MNDKCKKVRLVFFFAIPRYFDFFNPQTETSKCCKYERETFRLQDVHANKLIETFLALPNIRDSETALWKS